MLQVGLLVGVLAMAFYTPYILCKGIHILAYESIDLKDKVLYFIPIFNVIKGERLYTGKLPTVGIATIAFIVLFLLRLAEAFIGVPNTLALVTIVLLMIALLAMYVTNFILVFRILKDADVNGIGTIAVLSFFYPLGQYYIGTWLPRVLKNSLKDEQTFI